MAVMPLFAIAAGTLLMAAEPAKEGEKAPKPKAAAEETSPINTAAPKPFPDITFLDARGTPHSLKDINSKLTLVHYWATWCVPCVRELPVIDAMQQTYGGKGLNIIAISMDGRNNIGKVNEFFAEHNITHLTAYVDNGAATEKLNISGLPVTYFVNVKGMVLATAIGSVDWDSPENRLLVEDTLEHSPK
jgi:thiol-disulfide isomerase/thioredoxin